jgi:acetyl-CoA carboxylase biotin carboxyl carrier protein
VSELEIKEGGVVVRLHRAQPLDGPPGSENLLERQDAILAEPSSTEITSPLVGTFYRSGEPDMPPLVEEGTRVEDDSVVGIVEVLNQPTEVEAGCSGVVTKVLAEDGQPVQYGQPLFEVSAVG